MQALAHETPRAPGRALGRTLALNLSFLGLASGVAYVVDSLAVWSEVLHLLGDLTALGVAVGAEAVGRRIRWARPAAAALNAVLLVGASLWIAGEAVARLLGEHAHATHGEPIFVVAVAGVAVNLASAWVLEPCAGRDLNTRGVYLHMLADAAGAVGALVASLFVMAGWPAADALASLVIAGAVGVSTLPLLRASAAALS